MLLEAFAEILCYLSHSFFQDYCVQMLPTNFHEKKIFKEDDKMWKLLI